MWISILHSAKKFFFNFVGANFMQNDNQIETDNFKMRRISALCLIIVVGLYLRFGDHNQTLELIMLGLAGFMIGASILQKNIPPN